MVNVDLFFIDFKSSGKELEAIWTAAFNTQPQVQALYVEDVIASRVLFETVTCAEIDKANGASHDTILSELLAEGDHSDLLELLLIDAFLHKEYPVLVQISDNILSALNFILNVGKCILKNLVLHHHVCLILRYSSRVLLPHQLND